MERLIIYFNSYQTIPLFSFGGVQPGGNSVGHCCDLNSFFPNKDAIEGLQGVLTVYNETIKIFKLSSPTFLSPLLNYAITSYFTSNTNPYSYYVMWILLDSDIDDIEKAEKEMEVADQYGLSVIILGIGNAEFKLMDEFVKCLNSKKRPFAQFYKYNDMLYKLNSSRIK